METSEVLPIWSKLKPSEQELLKNSVRERKVEAGAEIYSSNQVCMGFVIVESGQLRALLHSNDGKELTLYRLIERDYCIFSASCAIHGLQFDISIVAEKPSSLIVIPTDIIRKLMDESTVFSNFINEIIASRFSEVMWLVEQVVWQSMDERLAEWLINESVLENANTLKVTHETIANHLGTAREVITRLLRYFQSEGIISLSRGEITILNRERLRKLNKKIRNI